VDRAIDIVNRALDVFGAPIYVRHEVVHNKFVVEDLRERGVFDATCPLVTKVHMEVARYSSEGRECILIGHRGHPEVEGTMGQYDHSAGGAIYLVEDEAQAAELEVRDPENLSYVTQTTLSMDDTARVIETLRVHLDAVKKLAADCDLVLVVGSPNSSNSNRLRELAARMGAEAHLLDGADDIDPAWLQGKSRIGVTAGASAPEVLVQEVIDGLCALGADAPIEVAGRPENVTFSLPRELRIDATNL
jgi:4-hydroxy-3-methylbut-2-enyl diphosphate reductase